MVDVFKEVGVKSAFIVYIQDTHGLEYSGAAETAFPDAGIEIKKMTAVPPDIADMTPIVNEAKASGADAFILFTYPDQSYPALGISQAVGYNPKVFMMGPGGSFDALLGVGGGSEKVEGIMWEGAWNTKQTPELDAFAKELQTFNEGSEGFGMDWWGHSVYYSGLEVLQGAIEGAGTLDNQKVADYIRDNHFTTVLGDTYFVNQELAPECYPGQIGQWQKGFPEVIDGENRTADPEYPKPAWPE
jgi:branched-chain amino acid transport system substrate-binding protein